MNDREFLIEILPENDEIIAISSDEPACIYILQNFVEYVRQSGKEKVFSKDHLVLIDSLIDKMWERINTGSFSEVAIATRNLYSIGCYMKILYILLENTNAENVKMCHNILDKSKLIGSTESLSENFRKFFKQIEKFLNSFVVIEQIDTLLRLKPLNLEKDLICDVTVRTLPTVEYFQKNFFQEKQPVLMRDCLNHWPALEKWRNINYLANIAGHHLVPIEIGSNYTGESWTQDVVSLKNFLYRQFTAEKHSPTDVEYLAQHNLFDQIPKLKDDIRIPDYCLVNDKEPDDIDIKAWLGPKGTVSPMHYDPKNNIFCQIFGKKQIILASNEQSTNLYPFENFLLKNTSQIDAESIDFSKFPLARNVKFHHLTIQEGECLFIPVGWWHFVKSLTPSFSVSFWW